MRSPRYWTIILLLAATALILHTRGDTDSVPPSEPLALMPPAVEFEPLSHEPITSSGGRGHHTEAAANFRSSVTNSAFNERASQR